MSVPRLAALAALCAALAAQAAGVPGIRKPLDATPKAAERLVLPEVSSPVELFLPAISAEKRRALESGMKPNQIGVSRRGDVEAGGRIDAASLRWVAAAGGYAAHIRVTSPGAEALRVGLRFTALPADLEVRAAAPGGRDVSRTTTALLHKLTNGAFPNEYWTASTEGDVQVIEFFAARRPEAGELAFTLVDVSHIFSNAVVPKAEFTCHVDVACVTNPTVRDAARAVGRMRFVEGGSAFVCTGSLLNDQSNSMTPLFASANHCIGSQAVASTLETWFFFYPDICGGLPAPPTRVLGGATLLMADFNTDFTLLRLNQPAPGGASFLGWDNAPLPVGTPVFGLHHPAGEFQRYSAGSMIASIRVIDSGTNITFAQPFNRINYTEGIIEGGSSGSPVLTGAGIFRGTLFGSPASNSCTANRLASYSDFSIGYLLAATFLAGPGATDDHADSAGGATAIGADSRRVAQINRDGDADWFRVSFTAAGTWTVGSFDPAPGGPTADVIGEIFASDGSTRLAINDDKSPTSRHFEIAQNVTPGTYFLRVTGHAGTTGAYGLSSSFALPDDHGNSPATASNLPNNGLGGGFLGTPTDEDWFRITFAGPGQFRVTSTGTTDVFARLFRSDGVTQISESDDIVLGVDTNFSIAANVNGADTYFLRVTGFDGAQGTYGLVTSFVTTIENPNYTDLWWNPNESGWGLNINHQANLIFATLFTYAADGRNLWLVASDLARQANGTYTGALYRTNGPVFNAQPWTPVTVTQVGTMTLTFNTPDAATLAYSVNGTNVTKQITRQRFGPAPTCVFTTGARTGATNVQDLWFNPSESGWGINLTQQGGTVFATLFTYAADNRDMWLVASDLRGSLGDGFTGPLYRISGPPFNAQPWTAVTVVPVGTMTVRFSTGSNATLTYSVDGVNVTKQIQRQVFGTQPTQCH